MSAILDVLYPPLCVYTNQYHTDHHFLQHIQVVFLLSRVLVDLIIIGVYERRDKRGQYSRVCRYLPPLPGPSVGKSFARLIARTGDLKEAMIATSELEPKYYYTRVYLACWTCNR
jgi:hypothetical protein